MKIGHLDPKAALANSVAERKPADKAAGRGEDEASAKVALSSAASSLAVAGGESFDAEKVERIAQAIRDGKFEVNPEAIADKLIANAQELLGNKPR